MCSSINHHIHEIDDSDCESDAADEFPYYRPISSNESDNDDEQGDTLPSLPNGFDLEHHRNANPNLSHLHSEIGVGALDLNSRGSIMVAPEDEELEEETTARELEASILRAFREDESRRTAPLSPENAATIVNAMRGVSFSGYTPEWADRVPEDLWLDYLRRLRGEATAATPRI